MFAMTEERGYEILATLGEAGGIIGMLTAVVGVIVRMIRRNGCTCRVYNCSGAPLLEVDCEKGAPAKRYVVEQPPTPTETTETTDSTSSTDTSSKV